MIKQRLNDLVNWFIREEKGNVLLLTTAAAIFATFGLYFFTALRDMSIKQKERVTHLYNATVIGLSIDDQQL